MLSTWTRNVKLRQTAVDELLKHALIFLKVFVKETDMEIVFPARIIDLHTHLFNARYVPLASVIASKIGRSGKDESRLANHVARLLEALTGSSYPERKPPAGFLDLDPIAQDEFWLEEIWNITKHELLATVGSLTLMEAGDSIMLAESLDSPVFVRLRESTLKDIIEDLSTIDYDAEGLGDIPLSTFHEVAPFNNLNPTGIFKEFLSWAEKAVKMALRAVNSLVGSDIYGKSDSSLRFFITMLHSEEQMVDKVFASYGSGLPSLQIVHYMMDMQKAYTLDKSPYYPYHPVQLDRMQSLQRAHPAHVFGFSAFDPRRGQNGEEDWRHLAEDALQRGFLGFKFYPAMGYKPIGNPPETEARVHSFYDFCINHDVPIFVHCTPTGFQTRRQEDGKNAHPKYWQEVLETDRWQSLRLCLGHAGGGRIVNGDQKSPGWVAESDEEWSCTDNYARIVSELCTTYSNVYCDVGYIIDLFEPDKQEVFVANIERARTEARNKNSPFDLLEKIAYGSDWHMPNMVDHAREYLDIFLGIMNRQPYQEYLDSFFWGNAYRFLKLPF